MLKDPVYGCWKLRSVATSECCSYNDIDNDDDDNNNNAITYNTYVMSSLICSCCVLYVVFHNYQIR